MYTFYNLKGELIMIKNRLIICSGEKVAIAAQDAYLGDAIEFANSRQDKTTLAQIGAYGNKYDAETVAKDMERPSCVIGSKKIFTIVSVEDGRYIGDIRLVELSDNIYEIGIVIVVGERSKGFGTEAIKMLSTYAFTGLNAEKVYARVYHNNPAAKKLYQRLGFSYEKTTDARYYVKGQNIPLDWLFIDHPIN